MKQLVLQTRPVRFLIAGTLLFATGCIRVPAGPHAKVYIQCSTEVTNALTPAMPCFTVAASKANKCEMTVSIVCSNGPGDTKTIQPGQQATLCCPENGVASTIKVNCKGGDGECRYYVVTHTAGAATKSKCFH